MHLQELHLIARRSLLCLTLFCCTALLGLAESPGAKQRNTAEPKNTIELTIDYGDGFQKRYTDISARVDFTALGVLEAAGRHPQPLKFKHRGSGATAFVESIDGMKNQGGGAKARNWAFSVNDQLGKQGAGVQPVVAGDHVLWKFKSRD